MGRGYAGGLITGVVLSLVAAALSPLWRPAVSRYARPAAKGAIKQGLLAFDVGRERVAELSETLEDLLAEAQMELAAERQPPASPAAAAVRPSGVDAA